MGRVSRYRLGFDPWGLGLFLAVMAPNFVWFALPPPNDIFRAASVTPLLDGAEQALRVVMAAAMCGVVNTARDGFGRPGPAAGAGLCVLLYFCVYKILRPVYRCITVVQFCNPKPPIAFPALLRQKAAGAAPRFAFPAAGASRRCLRHAVRPRRPCVVCLIVICLIKKCGGYTLPTRRIKSKCKFHQSAPSLLIFS